MRLAFLAPLLLVLAVLTEPIALLAASILLYSACVHTPAPQPAPVDASAPPSTVFPAPSGVQTIPSASTASGEAAPRTPCEAAEANLQRLQCRPEGFSPPGADPFAKVCERMSGLTHFDAPCLARAPSIAAVRDCRSAVTCRESR